MTDDVPRPPLHPTMDEHLAFLELRGRRRTATGRRTVLTDFAAWLRSEGIDALAVTADQLMAYQQYLATVFRSTRGAPLGREGLASRVFRLKAYYRWLSERGLIVADPARGLRVHVPRSRVVLRDHLTLQEASAMLRTQARRIETKRVGTPRWAIEVRNLALLCLALATGRRRSGLIALRIEHIDLANREVRCEWEKGHAGRVLPVIGWAMDVLAWYLAEARPILLRDPATPWLFLGRSGDRPMTDAMPWYLFKPILARTIAENPDLTELPGKHITLHSLRVSFATLLFSNGCDIRSVNELLLHRSLSTTGRYTPVEVDDLRQVFRSAHPRA